jgi:hypothetical protein
MIASNARLPVSHAMMQASYVDMWDMAKTGQTKRDSHAQNGRGALD